MISKFWVEAFGLILMIIFTAFQVICIAIGFKFDNRLEKLLFLLAWILLAIVLFVIFVNKDLGGFGNIGFYKFIALFVSFLACLLASFLNLLLTIITVYILNWILKKLFKLIGFKHRYK